MFNVRRPLSSLSQKNSIVTKTSSVTIVFMAMHYKHSIKEIEGVFTYFLILFFWKTLYLETWYKLKYLGVNGMYSEDYLKMPERVRQPEMNFVPLHDKLKICSAPRQPSINSKDFLYCLIC